MEKVVVFSADGSYAVKKFTTGKDMTDAEIRTAWDRAVASAAKDGFRGMNYDVPENYLAEQGLVLSDVSPVSIDTKKVRDNGCPISLCLCCNCASYEEGFCLRYGAHVDEFASGYEVDCLHGTCGYYLACNGKPGAWSGELTAISAPFQFNRSKISPIEVIEFLLSTNDTEFAEMKQELIDFMQDECEGGNNWREYLWGFVADVC